MRFPRLPTALIVSLFALAMTSSLRADLTEWKDVEGNTFTAEPVEVLGSLAIFSTGPVSGKIVLLRGLSPADCRRFYSEIAEKSRRAERWSGAQGAATSDVMGRALKVENQALVSVDLSAVPEPEVLFLIFGSKNDEQLGDVFGELKALHKDLQQSANGRAAIVFMGVGHTAAEHAALAVDQQMPWIVSDFQEQPSMQQLIRFTPRKGPLLVALSRDGAPLLFQPAPDKASATKFVEDARELLTQLDPANPKTWKDRAHYLAAIRPIQYAQSRSGPVLVGDPLVAQGLRQRNVKRIEATVNVAADGTVTNVTLLPASDFPEAMTKALSDALQRSAIFVPAIEFGTTAPGVYTYSKIIPPTDK